MLYCFGMGRSDRAGCVLRGWLVLSLMAGGTGLRGQQGVSSLSAPWQPMGPGSVVTAAYGKISGRVTAVALDPADATGNTVYVGTTGGGVWKSMNAAGPAAALSFVPLTDRLGVFNASDGSAAMASLSVGALSAQGGVVLAGTGDPNDATDSYYGSGVLRSADGGVTWTLARGWRDGFSAFHSFMGLGFAGFAWSSTQTGLVVAAVSQAAEGVRVNAGGGAMGLYYSIDAGATWQMATVMDGSQTVQDPNSTVWQGRYAATTVVWNPVRQRFYGALQYRGYFESADGVNWTRVAGQPGTGLSAAACHSGTASCPVFRGMLAVQPVTGDMFALTVGSGNLDQGLWQDVCARGASGCAAAANFATRLGGTALEVGSGSSVIFQGDYNLALAAVSESGGDTTLYVGTVDVYRCSLAVGCSLRNTTNAANGCANAAKVAPAQHTIAVLGGAGTGGLALVFVGNDGGLWRSLDGIDEQAATCSADDATHFDNLNGGIGSLAEVVSFAQHPTDAGTLLVGLGTNGTAGTGSAGTTASWAQFSAAEGGVVAIDAANPALWYVSTGAGVKVTQCAKGAGCTAADFAGSATTVATAQVGGDAALMDATWMLAPLVPAELLVGTCRVWRGPAGSPELWSSTNAIGAMFAGSGAACAATNNGLVRSLAAGGAASGATSAQNAGATVLYAGMAGVSNGGGTVGGHVFMTNAGGTATAATAWTDVGASPVTNDTANGGFFNVGGFDVSSLAVDAHDATGLTVYATVMGFSGNGVAAPHVYRSVDGGAHWTNVSSNLPNTPANSVVVDPNDANTVYVAMDTGVYVTTKITNCADVNCWSVYGTALPNAPAIQLQAAAGMTTGDGRTGELRVGTYGRGIWQIPLMTATAAAAPAMSVAPVSLTFASQTVGKTSAAQSVTITNTGTAALVVSQVAVTGDFHASDTCVSGTVAVGGTCTVQVSFLPSVVGARNGLLTVYGNVAGGQATVSLSGTATAAGDIVLDPVTIAFTATTIGATSATQYVTISNTGSGDKNLATISVSGDYVLSANTCGSSLAAGVGCTVGIAFKPASAGARSGMLTVVDGAGTQTAALSGTGTSPATDGLSPLSLSFAPQQLNTASGAQLLTVTNVGDVALTLIATKVTAGDFVAVNGCGNSLNGHSICTVAVTFVPKSVGPGTGTVVVTDQFRSQTVTLSGTGLAPPGVSLSPASMTLGVTAVGSSSAGQAVTLTNNGGLPLNVASVTVSGDFEIVAASSTCGSVVAAGSSCTLQVVFAPTTGGPRNGKLTVTDNAAGSPQTVSLTGTGVDFAFAANGPTAVTVTNGLSATYPLLLSSTANVPGTAVLSCAGVPAYATCTISPPSVTLGGTSTVAVTVQTGVAATSALREPPWKHGVAWLAALLPLGWLLRRKAAVAVLSLCLLTGCGLGRTIPSSASGGGSSGSGSGAVTPSGAYTVTVSASSAGLVRVVNLTLIVQ